MLCDLYIFADQDTDAWWRCHITASGKCGMCTWGTAVRRLVWLAGAIGMSIADIMDPVYITVAPKTFVLKLCIGLIVGLVAHRIAKINESSDKKYVLRWSVIASVAGLGFNVIADPLVGYFYKQWILGQPQEMAEVLAKWSTATTFVNAVVSVILVGVVYNALRPVLLRSGLIHMKRKAV